MSWTAIETTKSVPAVGSPRYRFGQDGSGVAKGTIPLVVWRCSGCRRYACTREGESPGACGKCSG